MVNQELKPLPSQIFIERLADTRDRKRLTQQQLADRLNAMDTPIDRSTIGKIESGKRGVTLDDLFAFAAALGVSPLALLVPRSDSRMRIAPAVEVDTTEVVFWARNLYALWPPQLEHDESDERFFASDATTDLEAKAYRNQPHLIAMTKLSSLLVTLSASDKPSDARLLKKTAGILSQLASQLIEDVDRAAEVTSLQKESGRRTPTRSAQIQEVPPK